MQSNQEINFASLYCINICKKKKSKVFTIDLFLPKGTLYGPTQLNHCEKRIRLKKINTSGIKSSHQPNNVFDRKGKG